MARKKLAARRQFVAEVDGATVVVLQGARFPVASAIVKQYAEMFEEPTEQATAAPGEKRKRSSPHGRLGTGFLSGRYREFGSSCPDEGAGPEREPDAPLRIAPNVKLLGDLATVGSWMSSRHLPAPCMRIPSGLSRRQAEVDR